MAADIPTVEPSRLVAGDTLKFTRTLGDYPASSGWVLTYSLVSAAQRYTFSGSASGNDHLVNVAATTTAGWAAGDYSWRAQVSLSGEVYTVAEGRMTIAPVFTSAQDARTHPRITLDAIEAVLENRASSSVAEYEIAGRRLRNIPIPELLMLRDKYRSEVAKEDAASDMARGLGDRRRVFVRFGP